MNTQVYPSVFTKEEQDAILQSHEVRNAKEAIDHKDSGSVDFTLPLTAEWKQRLESVFSLNLSTVDHVPMRWIKGDTHPHMDVGAHAFDSTYLVYLTDSSGHLVLDQTEYPIEAGTGYVFSEGIRHETLQTGTVPRLLLGPMNETATSVGNSGIAGPGGSTLSIRQNGPVVEYSSNQTDWYEIYWPIAVQNTDTESGMLTIEFSSNLTLTNSYHYFVCITPNIQFGSSSVKEDGTRPILTVNSVSDYPGLIQNSYYDGNGTNTIFVYNLDIRSINGSTLGADAGWIGQNSYGKGATNNYIINCSSDGDIGPSCGGIVGSNAGSESGTQLTLIGCSSSGSIVNGGSYAGGIVGANAGVNGGSVICRGCWSTGIIDGTYSGGIVGSGAGYTEGSLLVQYCYSTGAISGTSAGGIVGYLARNATIQHCYTHGVILGPYSGGIIGDGCDAIQLANCYTTGSIGIDSLVTNAGGIVGANAASYGIQQCYTTGVAANNIGYIVAGSSTIPANCYSEAEQGFTGWNESHAASTLTGVPSVNRIGSVWISRTENTPYLLLSIGYTSYAANMIVENDLVKESTLTVSAGQPSSYAIPSNAAYEIIEIANGDSGSYSTITIHPTNGSLLTTSETVPGTYTVYIDREGSYYITVLTLIVTESTNPCGCQLPIEFKNMDYERRYGLLDGNIMLTYMNPQRPLTYDEIIKMKIAKASRS